MADLTLRRRRVGMGLPKPDQLVIAERQDGGLILVTGVAVAEREEGIPEGMEIVAWYAIPEAVPRETLEIPKETKKPRKLSLVQQYIKSCCEAWNQHRRKTWPEVNVKVPGTRLIGYLQGVAAGVDKNYDEALNVVTDGIKWYAKDEFYADKVFTFVEIAAKEKLQIAHAKSKLAKTQREERASSPLHTVGLQVLYQGSIQATVEGWEGDRVVIRLPDSSIFEVPEYTLRAVTLEA